MYVSIQKLIWNTITQFWLIPSASENQCLSLIPTYIQASNVNCFYFLLSQTLRTVQEHYSLTVCCLHLQYPWLHRNCTIRVKWCAPYCGYPHPFTGDNIKNLFCVCSTDLLNPNALLARSLSRSSSLSLWNRRSSSVTSDSLWTVDCSWSFRSTEDSEIKNQYIR